MSELDRAEQALVLGRGRGAVDEELRIVRASGSGGSDVVLDDRSGGLREAALELPGVLPEPSGDRDGAPEPPWLITRRRAVPGILAVPRSGRSTVELQEVVR